MPSLPELWEQISGHLTRARRQLDGKNGTAIHTGQARAELSGSLEEFDEFLEHNELELAWDALAAVAHRHHAAPSVWHELSEAAALMGLQDRRDRALHEARAIESPVSN